MRFNEKCQEENPKRKLLQPTPLPAEAEVMPMGKWARAGKMNKAPTHNNAIIIINIIGPQQRSPEIGGSGGHRQWGKLVKPGATNDGRCFK